MDDNKENKISKNDLNNCFKGNFYCLYWFQAGHQQLLQKLSQLFNEHGKNNDATLSYSELKGCFKKIGFFLNEQE